MEEEELKCARWGGILDSRSNRQGPNAVGVSGGVGSNKGAITIADKITLVDKVSRRALRVTKRRYDECFLGLEAKSI